MIDLSWFPKLNTSDFGALISCNDNNQIFYLLKLFIYFWWFYRVRNDGSFTKANCSSVATIRELPSSKENRSNKRYSNVIKPGQITARMTETCDGHTPRHRAPLPPVEVSFRFLKLFHARCVFK